MRRSKAGRTFRPGAWGIERSPGLCKAGQAAVLWILACGAAQGQIIEAARAVSLSYSGWLPNLVCSEHIRRLVDYGGSAGWVETDSLMAQVTYFEQQESYKLVSRSGGAVRQKLENLPGAISEGEFGSTLRSIFDPASAATFEAKGQETIRRQKTWVFAYRVDREGSRLELRALSKSVFAGFHGLVYIDDATKRVLRLTAEADAPPDFPIRDSYIRIEYDWTSIAGGRYLVPVRAETGMAETAPIAGRDPAAPAIGQTVKYRNLLEFRGYRKYTADSRLRFDTPKPGVLQ